MTPEPQRPIDEAKAIAVPVAPALGVEDLLANILRFGVYACFILVAFGTALSFLNHPEYLSSVDELRRVVETPAPRSLAEILESASTAHGRGFVMLGLLVMIATPVFRVAMSLLVFQRQRDRLFTFISAAVLALLALSFWLGHVHP